MADAVDDSVGQESKTEAIEEKVRILWHFICWRSGPLRAREVSKDRLCDLQADPTQKALYKFERRRPAEVRCQPC